MSKGVLGDDKLVEFIKKGGKDRMIALEQIYRSPGLKDRILNFVTYRGGDSTAGEDVFTESIIITERNIRADKFKGESAITTYVFGVAKKYWANKRRAVNHITRSLEDQHLQLTDFQNPELIFISEEIKEKLSKIMDLLSEKCRTVLRLWSNNIKYAEIAVELKVENTSQLRKLKYDCQQKLKEALINRPEMIPNYYNGRS